MTYFELKHFRPVDENIIGRWRFVLLAADNEGLSAQDVLQVTVRQFTGSRRINHQFELELTFTEWRPNLINNWGWMVRTQNTFRRHSVVNYI